jgi:hypothetical protein
MIDTTARIQFPDDVLYNDLGGEAVIVNLVTGKYYGLDEVGARAWALLAEHGRIEPAYQALLAEYDVDEAQLRRDLSQLIEALADRGLGRIVEA